MNYQEILLPNGNRITGVIPTGLFFNEIKKIVPFKGMSVLDVGCAEGMYSVHAAMNGARSAYLIDKEAYKLLSARDNLLMVGRFEGTFEHVSADDFQSTESFDVVLMPMVIHWFSKPKDTFKRMCGLANRYVVVVFREPNEHYHESNGNWFPTETELMETVPPGFRLIRSKVLYEQDNGKTIRLCIFQVRAKRVGNTVVKRGMYTKEWRKDLETFMTGYRPDVFIDFTQDGYVEKYIDGVDLWGDPAFEYDHGHGNIKHETSKVAIAKMLHDVVEAGIKTGKIIGDITLRNIMVDREGKAYLIDFEHVDDVSDGTLTTRPRITQWQDILDYLGADHKFDGDMQGLLRALKNVV